MAYSGAPALLSPQLVLRPTTPLQRCRVVPSTAAGRPAHLPPHSNTMALRSRARVLLDAAKPDSAVVEGGLRGFMIRVRERLSTGKLLRPDVEDDVLRKPVSEAAFRYPPPGAQQPPIVPQGPYSNVFDITYHSRDARRLNKREQLNVEDARSAGLPPTPGNPAKATYLGLAGDFDRQA